MLDYPLRRSILIVCAFACLAFLTFVFSAWNLIPIERIRANFETKILSQGYMVSTRSLDLGWFPGNINVEGLILKSAGNEQSVPLAIIVDEVNLSLDLIPLLFFQTMSGNVFAEIGDGVFEADFSLDENVSIEGEFVRMPFSRMKLNQFMLGLPLLGNLDGTVALEIPKKRLSKMSGIVELQCLSCALGAGEITFPKTSSNPMNALGSFSLNQNLIFGDLRLNANIKEGVVLFTDISSKSEDVEMIVKGKGRFKKRMKSSTLDVCIQYKVKQMFYEKNPKFELILKRFIKDESTFNNIHLAGRLSHITPRSVERCK